MDKSMYKALAALYKEYKLKVNALREEVNKRMCEIVPEVKVRDFINYCSRVQLFVDKPSDGAEFFGVLYGIETYHIKVDDVLFVETIEKND